MASSAPDHLRTPGLISNRPFYEGIKVGPLGREAGSRTPLVRRGEVVGMAVRTRTDVSPVYVSVGHNVDIASAVEWVLASCRGRRLPETARLAHQAAAGGLAPGRRELTAVGVGLEKPERKKPAAR